MERITQIVKLYRAKDLAGLMELRATYFDAYTENENAISVEVYRELWKIAAKYSRKLRSELKDQKKRYLWN